MSDFHALRWTTPSSDTFLPLAQPQTAIHDLNWHQPAELVFDRFADDAILRLPQSMLLPDAEHLLHEHDKRYAVVTTEVGQTVGIILTRDLHNRHSVAMSQLLQLPWQELTLSHVMIEARRQPMITDQQLKQAKIGDIAATLQAAGRDFIWITDGKNLLGLVSSLTVLARTGESVRLFPRAETFSEIFKALKHTHLIES